MIDYTVKPVRLQRPIDAEPFHRYIFDDGTVWTEFYRRDDGYLLRFPDLADFEPARPPRPEPPGAPFLSRERRHRGRWLCCVPR